jgi:two-component sensor histidine kinase/sensor domain CHASE-containing protein
MIGLCLLIGGVFGRLMFEEYARLEREDMKLQVKRRIEGLREYVDRLSSTAGDWAPWDASYAFLRGNNPRFASENLDDAVFMNLGLSLIVFLDATGSVVWSGAFDLSTKKVVPVPADFSDLPADDLLLRHADARSGVQGIVKLSGNRIMFVAARPVTTSDYSAAPVGTLIMGRMLDSAEVGRISERASSDLEFARADDPALPPDFARALPGLALGGPAYVSPLDEKRVDGYALLPDISGEGAVLLRVRSPRDIYRQGLHSFGYLVFALGLAAFFASVVVSLLVGLLVLGRISKLSADIQRIGTTRDLRSRVAIGGGDELAVLASNVNAMLAGLESAQHDLSASLAEKELLLREIHHRVKNNLQVVSSLLNLQSGVTEDERARAALRESQGRIHSMALIHEFLYGESGDRPPDLARVDFRGYLSRLSSSLMSAYQVDQSRIKLEISEREIYLDADSAVSCGLLVNELLSNCLKHAFPDGREGKVFIGIEAGEEDEITIFVKDDGVGFPPGFDPLKAGSMGLRLVRALVHQLHGRTEFANEGGSSIGFAFRAPRVARAD